MLQRWLPSESMHFSTAKSMIEPEATSDAISNRLLVYVDEIGRTGRREGDIRFIEVWGLMQPVATRPAVRIACGDGMYILDFADGGEVDVWFLVCLKVEERKCGEYKQTRSTTKG